MNLNEYRSEIFGYIFGFIGTTFLVEVLTAFALGFVGALAGWLFEKLKKKFLTNDKKSSDTKT